MAGLYIHIPFCKTRCAYCDFYSTTSEDLINEYIDSIISEMRLRKYYLTDNHLDTVYFGGGTPSLLKRNDFCKIFEVINELFILNEEAEITFEANPDDLTKEYLQSLEGLPFNRISLGIQSFNDKLLQIINRRHTSEQAIEAVKNAQETGYQNISIDLIYGLPAQTLNNLEKELDTALSLGIQHISAYGLTYEDGTVLKQLLDKGKIQSAEDELMIEMYQLLNKKTAEEGFERYEISNFALDGYRSRHNSSYWKQKPYMGIGPSAHSYDGHSRQWNINSLTQYIEAVRSGKPFFEKEELSVNDKYNDKIMVSLRTSDGLNLNELEKEFGKEWKDYCLKNVKSFIETQKISYTDGIIRLTVNGIMISDHIISSLMKV